VTFTNDRWLSSALGRATFRIDLPETGIDAARVVEDVRRHRGSQAAAMYFAKTDTGRIDAVRALGAAGLYVVDVNVTFEIAAEQVRPMPASPVAVRPIAAGEHDAVLRIAGSCFRHSRFHLDPALPGSVANDIKRAWIKSYVDGARGDELLVAFLEGRPAGFLAVLLAAETGRRVAVIDLVGVDTACQGQGVGRALVSAFFERYRQTCAVFRVGTQAANLPSLALYEGLGFGVARTTYVMHGHVPDPTAIAVVRAKGSSQGR
jgi:ribosomal protein S18 acetylase RimI-like enzyme